jgi:hypothetical protein
MSGSIEQLPGPTGCADWSVGTSELVLTRSEPLSPTDWSCQPTSRSTLPGFSIRFPDAAGCSFKLSQARAGLRIPYQVVATQQLTGVRSRPQDIGGCGVAKPGELSLFEKLSGNQQSYALNDVGGCGGIHPGPSQTIEPGTTEYTFEWDGRNWTGPSDTTVPKGEPFPSGVYTLQVRAVGEYNDTSGDDAGTGSLFEVAGSIDILLTDD